MIYDELKKIEEIAGNTEASDELDKLMVYINMVDSGNNIDYDWLVDLMAMQDCVYYDDEHIEEKIEDSYGSFDENDIREITKKIQLSVTKLHKVLELFEQKTGISVYFQYFQHLEEHEVYFDFNTMRVLDFVGKSMSLVNK